MRSCVTYMYVELDRSYVASCGGDSLAHLTIYHSYTEVVKSHVKNLYLFSDLVIWP